MSAPVSDLDFDFEFLGDSAESPKRRRRRRRDDDLSPVVTIRLPPTEEPRGRGNITIVIDYHLEIDNPADVLAVAAAVLRAGGSHV